MLNRLNDTESICDILLIEDDTDDLKILEKLLTESEKYNPILANGGPKGWDIISNNPPQAVILNLFMSEMDGFEIIDAMQASKDLRNIPIIAISGENLSETQEEKLASLNLHLLKKGALNTKDLLSTIERSLSHLKSPSDQLDEELAAPLTQI